ncbi:MAG: 4Fe-4S binding protein [Deltaproteobacteria bacterium]|nr:4Fe-4S binding protein [Deltaproteobacteria bacterium]
MKSTRKIIRIDEEKCDGCGLCVPSCAEGAIRVVDGKARLVAEKYCDGLGACLGECPRGALAVIDAEAEPFDEAAAKELVRKERGPLRERTSEEGATGGTLPCGCPSAQLQSFAPQTACDRANIPVLNPGSAASALRHWPVQIRLVPPSAPFLKGADLLVAADCTPVAYARFHEDLLRGKTVLMGCPKFDDAEAYVEKFTAIFETAGIKSVTVAVMEVPCCQGLPAIVRKAMALSGKQIPLEVVVISTRGERR